MHSSRIQLLGLGLAGLISLCFSVPVFAVTPTSEYRLKAALIFKLTKFVEWSENSALKAVNFNICLLGDDNFGEALDALELKKVHALPIKVQRFSQSESVNSICQILFISRSKQTFEKDIIDSFTGQTMLTLGESENFAIHGGMIQFSLEDKRIGFKINLKSARENGLKIAAPLLQLATIVNTEEE